MSRRRASTPVAVEYVAAMRRRGLAPGTVYKRDRELRAWLRFRPSWRTATARDVEAWLDARPLGPATRASTVSHLSAFYRWAIRVEYVDTDPTVRVERARVPVRLPRPARADHVEHAIAAADPTMRAVLLLMARAGLRCCEVARLRWDDVDLDAGTAYVRGKGDRERLVGLPRRLAAALAALDGLSGPVFPGWQAPEGDRAPGRVVSHRTNAYLRAVGVSETAHQLRHRYATDLLRATAGDLLAVQHALGHASVATTQVYAAADVDRALAAARALD